MRIEGGSPNIINGVSRQPPEVRLVSQLEESVNQFPTISRGLVSRNPVKLRAALNGSIPANTFVHLIDRDEVEQYVALIHPSGIRVFDLDGDEKTVNAPGGYGYLSGASLKSLRALTVQDHTFILNRDKVVGKDPDTTPDLVTEGLIHIVQGDYFTEYKVIVDGTLVAQYVTDGGPYSAEGDARKAERGIRTGVIAKQLADGSPPSGITTIPANAALNLTTSLGTTDWDIAVMDNVIHLTRTDGADFTLEVEAGSENRIRAHKGTSTMLSELPRKAPEGFTIKISGGAETDYDDYWVQFSQGALDAQGAWKEVAAPGVQYKMDPTTLPHLLVREANGTFTFKPADWKERKVGDEDTNPWPSFVDQKIAGLAFGNNRFGMFSGEALSQSSAGAFFDFFAASILTPLDSDPVDASISYPEVSTINHVVPFAGETILFTQSVPFRLGKGDTLTQKSVHYEHLIENKVSKDVRPVAAGSKLYFANSTPSGSFIHEFSYDRTVDNLSAQCITDHVAGYLPDKISMMEADGDLKILVLTSPDCPHELYVHKWLWIGDEKAQSAWQMWTLPGAIRAMRFYGEELVIIADSDLGWDIQTINCHEAWLDGGPCPVYLDKQLEPVGTYDPNTERTTYTLPYDAAGAIAISREVDTFGYAPRVRDDTGFDLEVDGDWTSKRVAVGLPFESYGILSQLLHRTTNNQGAYGNAIPGINTTIASVKLGTGDTAFLKVELFRNYRRPIVTELSAALTGTHSGMLGPLVIGRVRKAISVMARTEDCVIKFGSAGPYPYSLVSYGWSGEAIQVTY